jgi:hypothetical protein
MRSRRHEDAPAIAADIDVDFFVWQLLDRVAPKDWDVEPKVVHQLRDKVINRSGEDLLRIKGVQGTL